MPHEMSDEITCSEFFVRHYPPLPVLHIFTHSHVSIQPTLREAEKQHYANFPSKAPTERTGTQDQRDGDRARRKRGACGSSRALQICIANEWSLSQGAFSFASPM